MTTTTTTTPAGKGAWHGDPAVHAEMQRTMGERAAADAIIRGVYVESDAAAPDGFKGSLLGCLLARRVDRAEWDNADWHRLADQELGLPRPFNWLAEAIFEGLRTDQESADFAVNLTAAIKPGADLRRITNQVIHDLLVDPDGGVINYTAAGSVQHAVVELVAGLYRRLLDGDTVSDEEWQTAASSKAGNAGSNSASHHAVDVARLAARRCLSRSMSGFTEGDGVENADHVGHATACVARSASYAASAAQYSWSDGSVAVYSWLAERLLHHLANA